MNELSRSEYNREYSSNATKNLNALLNLIDKEKEFVDEAIKSLKKLCLMIPHTPEIYLNAKLRDLSSKPPFKFNDCQIYSSVLDFASKSKDDQKIIFLTKDRDDFDYLEIHEELEALDVKLMFSSGNLVKEVMRLID